MQKTERENERERQYECVCARETCVEALLQSCRVFLW